MFPPKTGQRISLTLRKTQSHEDKKEPRLPAGRFTSKFKAKVVLEALSEPYLLAELAQRITFIPVLSLKSDPIMVLQSGS